MSLSKKINLVLNGIVVGLFLCSSFGMAQELFETVVLGDIEGQWDRLESFVQGNKAFSRDANGQIKLNPGYRFVFMGDAVDKGKSSLRILSTLLNLKESYPNRVTLILGNRDINKLRLPHELSEESLKAIPGVDGPTHLKWILKETMGAPKAFEYRRQELSETLNQPVTDLDVLKSFLDDFDPVRGIMTRYLKASQLIFRDAANKTLFVHGGLTSEAFGRIPGVSDHVADLATWIQNLNQWAQNSIVEGIETKNGSPQLVQYQNPLPGTVANQESIVYARNFDLSANPEMIPEALQEELLRQGIETLVVGHTPVGEIPVIISNGRFRIIFVDNSMSSQNGSAHVSLKGGTLEVIAKSPQPEFGPIIHYKHSLSHPSVLGTRNGNGLIVGVSKDKVLSFHVDKDNGFKTEYTVLPFTGYWLGQCWGLAEF